MARILKEEEYAARRNEILDVTQKLVYTKGYEQITIQDILDELKISKGAFYHYFSSKQALLPALIERMAEEADKVLLPILEDPELSATEKLMRFFETGARWKTAQKKYLLALMKVWYADENAILRQKVQASMIKRTAPQLTPIIKQGLREGVFNTHFPDQVGEIVLNLLAGVGETFVEALFAANMTDEESERIRKSIEAYNHAVERILGAPAGVLRLIEIETLNDWLVFNRDEKMVSTVSAQAS